MNEMTGEAYNREFVRKAWPLLALYSGAGWVRPPAGGDERGYYDDKRLEMEKERVRLRDERNELSRVQRDMARKDSMVDLWKRVVRESVVPFEPVVAPTGERPVGDTDLIVHLTDLHAGLVIDNFANRYDEDVLVARLDTYLDNIRAVAARHNARNCYLMLGGDLISGTIHTPLRIEANMDAMRQVKFVSLAASSFTRELSKFFNEVHVYSVAGNHSRLFPNKKENAKGENLDVLVPFYMAAKLDRCENVFVYDENIEESISNFEVRGQIVCGVHGDKDSMESVVQKLTMFLGEKPDMVFAGHRHTNGMRTVYDSKVIESGCVSGPDNFCMDHRLQNKPEQMVAVVGDRGLECLYDIKLD